MGLIPITGGVGKESGRQGNVRGPEILAWAEVDDKHLPELAEHCWHFLAGCYPGTSLKGPDGKRRQVYLHHLIFRLKAGRDPLPGLEVDHADRNPLNATEANLREATPQKQRANQNIRKDNTSGFRGVYWNKRFGKWECKTNLDRQTHFLGYFPPTEQGWRAAAFQVRQLILAAHPDVTHVNEDWETRPYTPPPNN